MTQPEPHSWNATDWRATLGRSGDMAARRCDGVNEPPPRTAFCIAGAARSFGTSLVQTALRHHLIRGYGAASTSRLFFLLKTADSDKQHEPSGAKAHISLRSSTSV